MTANTCPACGAETVTNARFCPSCGHDLRDQRLVHDTLVTRPAPDRSAWRGWVFGLGVALCLIVGLVWFGSSAWQWIASTARTDATTPAPPTAVGGAPTLVSQTAGTASAAPGAASPAAGAAGQ